MKKRHFSLHVLIKEKKEQKRTMNKGLSRKGTIGVEGQVSVRVGLALGVALGLRLRLMSCVKVRIGGRVRVNVKG